MLSTLGHAHKDCLEPQVFRLRACVHSQYSCRVQQEQLLIWCPCAACCALLPLYQVGFGHSPAPLVPHCGEPDANPGSVHRHRVTMLRVLCMGTGDEKRPLGGSYAEVSRSADRDSSNSEVQLLG